MKGKSDKCQDRRSKKENRQRYHELKFIGRILRQKAHEEKKFSKFKSTTSSYISSEAKFYDFLF
jgi:hypothetical protein